MKRFLRSKLILSLAAFVMIAAAVVIPLSGNIAHSHATSSIPWNIGDVFVGVSNGKYNVYDNTGALKDSVNDGQGGFTTGCAFNGGLDKLYTTNFSNTKVEVYDNAIPHTLSQTVDTAANGGSASESVVFASNGDFYVGNAGANAILRYNAAGTFQQSYAAATEDRGTDWLDLASDQKTMFYTSEGGRIMRFDVSGAGAQLADFANIGGVSYALRLLPPGDGSGGLLVANSTDIKRLDGAGNVVQTYDAPGEDSWFALNLDPNGKSFWAGDFSTGDFYRFNIATGAVEVGPINTGTGANTLFGICVKGEPAAALSRPKLFIFLQGINSSLSQFDIDGNSTPGFDAIYSRIQQQFPDANFRPYSYAGLDTNGHVQQYPCDTTFTQSLKKDVQNLDAEITTYLTTIPNADVYLVGHSMGGMIAFGELSFLHQLGKFSLANNGRLAGVITLDSPLGGVTNNGGFLADVTTFARFDCSLNLGQLISVNQLVTLFKNTGSSHPLGGKASIDGLFFGGSLTNDALAQTALAHRVSVLTIGNLRDYLYDPGACPLPKHPQGDFRDTQWLDDQSPTPIFGRDFRDGDAPCSTTTFLLGALDHLNVLTNADMLDGMMQFLQGLSPNPQTLPVETNPPPAP